MTPLNMGTTGSSATTDGSKRRLRPMRGLRTDRTASTVIRGHAFIQNLRRGHYELEVESRHEHLRVAAAFDELNASI
jgi:IS6 family transposase